jgi:hypothetical protein
MNTNCELGSSICSDWWLLQNQVPGSSETPVQTFQITWHHIPEDTYSLPNVTGSSLYYEHCMYDSAQYYIFHTECSTVYWMTWPYADNLQPFIKMYYYNQVPKTLPGQTSNLSLSVIRIKILCLTMVTVWHKKKVSNCLYEGASVS